MRFEGRIKSWNDARGFGFIEPAKGGEEIFAHIKAFPARAGRPSLGQLVSFELELNGNGQKRAKRIELLRPAVRKPTRSIESPAPWGTASVLAIPALVAIYVFVSVTWHVSHWFAAAYVGLSFVCFMVYAADKSAARAGRQRVPESTLHGLAVVGGWPGALVAQQLLRHKSSKVEFRRTFWATAVANVAAFVAIHLPIVG